MSRPDRRAGNPAGTAGHSARAPVVVPDASTLTALSPAGEVFLQNDKLDVGLNPFGGIGTLNAAPPVFRTDVRTGLKRLGLFDGKHDDVILQGRAIDLFMLSINGRRYANGQLTGFTQIPGKFSDPSRWLGLVAGVEVEQIVRLDGPTVHFDMNLTNRSLAPVTLGYLRAVDPDQSDLYDTTNTAIVGGVESTLQGKGGTFYLRDIAGRATIATASYNKSAEIGAALAIGATRKGDYVVQLVFAPITLAPGQSVTHSFEMGVR
ncbi:hypothetical protein U1737_13680 [Sphingomonas sp. LB3N6]|uniref:hypothetical protein n=1 Tax=Sphingomonas fucosidasi TaxID=3096164 RepID=UPI002FC5CF3E